MQISRTFAVAAPIESVWKFITTPAEVGPCMPGCQHVEVTEPGKYKAVMAVKVGPIKTTFNFDIETVEERPPEHAVFSIRGNEGGNASRVNAENTLTLKQVSSNSTEVTYSSKVNIVGRLGKFAGGVMQKMAESMSDQFIDALRSRLEPESLTAAVPQEAPENIGLMTRLIAFISNLGKKARQLFLPSR